MSGRRSEPMERAAAVPGAMSLTLDVVVLPGQVAVLAEEGRRAWGTQYKLALPGGWEDEDYVLYALKARMRLPVEDETPDQRSAR